MIHASSWKEGGKGVKYKIWQTFDSVASPLPPLLLQQPLQ
jgi:hypothetical protein